MARTVNGARHAIRREAFLDVAQRLIQAKGYEQMSVQDVLDELDVSKGAFYHYFDSKVALLEAVVERMVVAATAAVAPVVADPDLPAAEKLARLFSGIARWKTERRELMLALLRVWYSDDNAIVREKLYQGMLTRFARLLATIIGQGRAEGVFSVSSPDDSARVLLWLIRGAQDLAGELFFARQANTITFEAVEGRFAAFEEAFERVLGAPAGSLTIADRSMLRQWFG
ncbi:MAG TPA: TetR/AcrR family transcriptional regulator [Candidatus Dormibacteraeota bacterium]